MPSLLTAREKIEQLIYGYADALDAGRLDDVSRLFEHGCIRIDGQSAAICGTDAVKKMFSFFTLFYDEKGRLVDIRKEAGKPFTRHVVSNVQFKALTENHARTTSCFTVLQGLPGSQMQAVVSGRYEDTFVCRDANWYFIERLEYIDLIGDISSHLRINPFGPT